VVFRAVAIARRRDVEAGVRKSSWNDRLKLSRSRVHHYEKERSKFPAGGTAAISAEIKGFSTPSLGNTRQSAFTEERGKRGKKVLVFPRKDLQKDEENFLGRKRDFSSVQDTLRPFIYAFLVMLRVF